MELEAAVVTAEVEQVREPSSEGQGFMAGSAEASVRSGLPLCGDPCFGFRSPEPGAEKDTEKWGCETLCQGWATTWRPGSRVSKTHGPQGQKLGCSLNRRVLVAGLLGAQEAGPGPKDGSYYES